MITQKQLDARDKYITFTKQFKVMDLNTYNTMHRLLDTIADADREARVMEIKIDPNTCDHVWEHVKEHNIFPEDYLIYGDNMDFYYCTKCRAFKK